jgi:hypothetical protein
MCEALQGQRGSQDVPGQSFRRAAFRGRGCGTMHARTVRCTALLPWLPRPLLAAAAAVAASVEGSARRRSRAARSEGCKFILTVCTARNACPGGTQSR